MSLKSEVFIDNQPVKDMDTFIAAVESLHDRGEIRVSIEGGAAQKFSELPMVSALSSEQNPVYETKFSDGSVWEWERQSDGEILELCRIMPWRLPVLPNVPESIILVYPYKDAPVHLHPLSRAAERGHRDDCIVVFPPSMELDFHSYPHWVDGLGSGNVAPDLVRLSDGSFVAICYT